MRATSVVHEPGEVGVRHRRRRGRIGSGSARCGDLHPLHGRRVDFARAGWRGSGRPSGADVGPPSCCRSSPISKCIEGGGRYAPSVTLKTGCCARPPVRPASASSTGRVIWVSICPGRCAALGDGHRHHGELHVRELLGSAGGRGRRSSRPGREGDEQHHHRHGIADRPRRDRGSPKPGLRSARSFAGASAGRGRGGRQAARRWRGRSPSIGRGVRDVLRRGSGRRRAGRPRAFSTIAANWPAGP